MCMADMQKRRPESEPKTVRNSGRLAALKDFCDQRVLVSNIPSWLMKTSVSSFPLLNVMVLPGIRGKEISLLPFLICIVFLSASHIPKRCLFLSRTSVISICSFINQLVDTMFKKFCMVSGYDTCKAHMIHRMDRVA